MGSGGQLIVHAFAVPALLDLAVLQQLGDGQAKFGTPQMGQTLQLVEGATVGLLDHLIDGLAIRFDSFEIHHV